MKTALLAGAAAVALVGALDATAAFARDNVQVAGSSTVLPYASIVAEAFGENFDFRPRSLNPVARPPVSPSSAKVLAKTPSTSPMRRA